MLKTVVLQQKEERDSLINKKYQQRIIQEECSEFLQSQLIKLITGPRRAGKSVFALQLLKGQIFAYLNFDDDLLLNHFDENFLMQQLLEIYPNFQYLLLDEIQNLPHWDIWVAKLYRRGINLIITGSNAKLLSSEMATALTGRYLQINILPFSFYEIIEYNCVSIKYDTPDEKAKLMHQMNDYLQMGGYPEIIKQRSITRNYLGSLFDSILLKDITKRYKVRHNSELYNLANYLLTNFCNPLSITQLAQDLQLGSIHTAKKYCQYLSEPYLFFFLPRFNSKLKLMQKAPQKVYSVDNGLIFARSFDLSKNMGRLLENLVFVELLRKGYLAGTTLFYYRTRNDKEIDFVCRKGFQVSRLIQVAYDIANPKTQKREISALLEASKELNCNDLRIITYDTEQEIKEKDHIIHVMPVWKWLLKR